MQNRRNYYRILRVQPDASHEVIQQSYRSLMQKLRFHPDLGGDIRNASIINQAYTTLRNPEIRAKYDAKLLKRQDIKILAAGSVLNAYLAMPNQEKIVYQNDNQRNYYRILHVQKDAEQEVIKASYQTLSKQIAGKNKQLIDEAYYVIGNAKQRQLYNTLLNLHAHQVSAKKLKDKQQITSQPNLNTVSALKAINQIDNPKTIPKDFLDQAYQPIINNCCKFCKTSYSDSHFVSQQSCCNQCKSPLSLPADIFANAPRRSLPRIPQSKKAYIYENWPGQPIQVSLEDLSPTGLNFSTMQSLDINQIIKVDANHFKAVAQVVHFKSGDSTNSFNATNTVGASFLAIEFFRTAGSFLSTSA